MSSNISRRVIAAGAISLLALGTGFGVAHAATGMPAPKASKTAVVKPTAKPSKMPTAKPSKMPTAKPSKMPTAKPKKTM